MKVNQEIKRVSITLSAHMSSFRHLINHPYFQYSNHLDLSEDLSKWLSLINSSRLHDYCHQQGYSIERKIEPKPNSFLNVRVGFVTADKQNCLSYWSCIGFGISASCGDGYPQTSTTCGNAMCGKLNNLNIDVFGYILVQ